MWKLWLVVVAFIGPNIVPSDANGACKALGGHCIDRTKNCCPERMTNGAYYCGSAKLACCLDFPKTAHHQHSGGSQPGSGQPGGGQIPPPKTECEHHGGWCVPTVDDCNCTYVDPHPSLCHPKGGVCCIDYPCGTQHVDGMCYVKRYYARRGNSSEPWTPINQIPDGCHGKKVARDPDCPGKKRGCIRHKILTLLECMSYACLPVGSDWLSVTTFIAPPDLCNGNGVVVFIPKRCDNIVDDLKQMCEDVGGTAIIFSNSGEKFLKCVCDY